MDTPLHLLQPDASGPVLHDGGDPQRKAYQGHITHDAVVNTWVGWVTYGPALYPQSHRSEVLRARNVRAVVAAVNDRIESKVKRGYQTPGGDGGHWEGKIEPALEADLIAEAEAHR